VEEIDKDPGAIAPRERDVLRAGLFDIVKKECGHAHASAGTMWRVSTRKGDIASRRL
jgi:hypothetical protein